MPEPRHFSADETIDNQSESLPGSVRQSSAWECLLSQQRTAERSPTAREVVMQTRPTISHREPRNLGLLHHSNAMNCGFG